MKSSYLSTQINDKGCNHQGSDKFSISAKGEWRENYMGRKAIRGSRLGRERFNPSYSVEGAQERLHHQDIRSIIYRFIVEAKSRLTPLRIIITTLALAFRAMVTLAYSYQRSLAVDAGKLASLHDYTGTYLPGVGV